MLFCFTLWRVAKAAFRKLLSDTPRWTLQGYAQI